MIVNLIDNYPLYESVEIIKEFVPTAQQLLSTQLRVLMSQISKLNSQEHHSEWLYKVAIKLQPLDNGMKVILSNLNLEQ